MRSRPGLAHLVTAGVLLAAFVVLTVLVAARWSPLQHLDDRLVAHTVRRTSGQQRPWRVVTQLLQPTVWRAAGLAAAVGLFLRARRRAAFAAVVVTALSLVLSTAVKAGVDRPRPSVEVYDAAGRSFPSGHALAAAAVATVLAGLVRRWWLTALAVVLVALTGASRLALGVHYPSDVLAGLLLGCGLGLGAAATTRRAER